MKITKQLLEEMVKEELNEGWKDAAAGLGVMGTLLGAFLAAEPQLKKSSEEKQIEVMQNVLKDMPADQAELKARAVVDGTEVLPQGLQKAAMKVAQDHLRLLREPVPSAGLTGEPDPASSWANENKSRLERIIAEELRKVLKA